MPIFARSALRRAAFHARIRICSRYRTARNTAAVLSRPKAENSLSPTIRRSSCEYWPSFRDDENFIKAFVSGQDFHALGGGSSFRRKAGGSHGRTAFVRKTPEFRHCLRHRSVAVRADDRPVADRRRKHDAANISALFAASMHTFATPAAASSTKRSVRTASGRMLRLRFDENDRQQVASSKRYGMNMPIQGTSADILKRALRLLHEKIRGTSAKLVKYRP